MQFLVRTLLEEVETRQKETGKPCRLIFVLDESGQWIEDSQERLSALQALVEEAADMSLALKSNVTSSCFFQ